MNELFLGSTFLPCIPALLLDIIHRIYCHDPATNHLHILLERKISQHAGYYTVINIKFHAAFFLKKSILYMCVFCLHICLFTAHMPGIYGGQQRALDLLELEFEWPVVSDCVGAGK